MYHSIRVLLYKIITIKEYHCVRVSHYPSIIMKEYQYIIVSLFESFTVLEYHFRVSQYHSIIMQEYCNRRVLLYKSILSSKTTVFRSSSVPPPFLRSVPPELLHAPCSAYIFRNNGRILMFKVSKRPYRSARHDEIICK